MAQFSPDGQPELNTWLDDAIELLQALGLANLQATKEGTIAAGQRHTGRTQILKTSDLFTCITDALPLLKFINEQLNKTIVFQYLSLSNIMAGRTWKGE